MRDLKIEHDGEWLVIVAIRYRHDREPKISRTYLGRDEAALVVELLRRELGPVTITATAGPSGSPDRNTRDSRR